MEKLKTSVYYYFGEYNTIETKKKFYGKTFTRMDILITVSSELGK